MAQLLKPMHDPHLIMVSHKDTGCILVPFRPELVRRHEDWLGRPADVGDAEGQRLRHAQRRLGQRGVWGLPDRLEQVPAASMQSGFQSGMI